MNVRLLKHVDTTAGPRKPGDEIDHPDAHRLCNLKIAEPLDDEAKEACAAFEERHRAVVARRLELAEAERQEKLAAAQAKQAKRTEAFAKKLK